MIRQFKEEDREDVINMSKEFWKHTEYTDVPFDTSSVSRMIDLCVSQGLMAVLEIEESVCGFACGIKGPLLGNNNYTSGVEVAFWINPDKRKGSNGIKLMRYLEALAKEAGVDYWSMVSMEASMPEIGKVYERSGYKVFETSYGKRL